MKNKEYNEGLRLMAKYGLREDQFMFGSYDPNINWWPKGTWR